MLCFEWLKKELTPPPPDRNVNGSLMSRLVCFCGVGKRMHWFCTGFSLLTGSLFSFEKQTCLDRYPPEKNCFTCSLYLNNY